MRLTVLLVAVICVTGISSKVIKKSQKEQALFTDEKGTQTKKKVQHQPAIIAIEIVDPNDNSTKLGRGRKRTIESSLGYGYQSLFNVQQKPPRYETYKYSQHDIPGGKTTYAATPTRHHTTHQTSSSKPQFEIQKSVQYDLGSTKPEFIPHKPQRNLNQYYQPGTTLYSTLDQNGHVGGLTSQEPQQSHNGMVPVIILRVFTNQLSQPGALHANIPQNHPYANLNSIDLQNLLAGYVQQQHPQTHQTYQQHPQTHQTYQQPQQVYQHQQTYEQPAHQQQTYEQPIYQQYEEPSHQQQTYEQPSHQQQTYEQQTYEQPQQVYYQQPTAVYQPQAYQQTYYSQPQYQKYQQPAHDDGLQTHENYPDDAHTKVIFHKEPVKQATKPKPVTKVAAPTTTTTTPQKFRITIPENTYSKVEVQEYETPQSPQQQQQYYYYQPDAEQQQLYYQYQDGKQYVQVATYPQEEQQYQQYQDVQYEQQPQSYQEQTTYEQIAPQEQHHENHDYNQHKMASDLGRDVNPKVYNYHAHGTQHAQKTRSTKKRRVRLPTKEVKTTEKSE